MGEVSCIINVCVSDNRGNVIIPLVATPDYTSMYTNKTSVNDKNSMVSQNKNEEKLGSYSYQRGNVDVATCHGVKGGI